MMQCGRMPAIDVDEQLRRDQESRITRRMPLVPRIEFSEVGETLANRVVQMPRASGRRLAALAILRSHALRGRHRSRIRAVGANVLPPAARGTTCIPRGRLPALGWLVTSQRVASLQQRTFNRAILYNLVPGLTGGRAGGPETTLTANPTLPSAAGQIE